MDVKNGAPRESKFDKVGMWKCGGDYLETSG